ncbi:MAG TPA: secretin N-terminal domain-containing protein [Thermodesulfovibrionales bacterium]|nr:secretin N-terminal domain-containing protein [Thermodesulfovibrionales bacterium]
MAQAETPVPAEGTSPSAPGVSTAETPPAGTEQEVPSEVKPQGTEQVPLPEAKPEELKQQTMPVPAAPSGRKRQQTVVQTPQAPQTPGTPSGPPVSFFFDDADVLDVIQTVFADILKVNYVIDQKVKGRVTFRTVTPIPRDEVLPIIAIILRITGVGFVEEQGLYRILPLPDVPNELVSAQEGKDPEKVAIELFTFKNISLKESMEDIQNAIGLGSQSGKIRIIPVFRLNAFMVVASTKERMEYVRKWVEAFDTMFAYARPKVMVYPLQNSKASNVASMLQSILTGGGGPGAAAPAPGAAPTQAPRPTQPGQAAAPGAAGAPSTGAAPSQPQKAGAAISVSGAGAGYLISPDTKIFSDEISNSLIILATPADYSFLEETIKKIDIVQRQVMIEALIVTVTLADNLSFGFSWSFAADVNISGIWPFKNPITLGGDAEINNPGAVITTGLPTQGFTFVATDPTNHVRAVITALAHDSKAKVLASPHILVSDNREARIQVGQQVPLSTSTTSTPISTGTTTVANTTTSTIQYKDIGIILKVKPQINDSGLVILELGQEVSSIGDNVVIAGQQFASINKEEVTTNLVTKDGETIIIGGLIREDTTKTKDGVPFLSKIPILGTLFSNTTDNVSRNEIIVLLTPHVMRSLTEAEKVTSDYLERYQGTSGKELGDFMKEKNKDSGEGGTKDVK